MGIPLDVSTTVKCAGCGAVYATEAPAAAIKEIKRCQECGATALQIVDGDESARERHDAAGAEASTTRPGRTTA